MSESLQRDPRGAKQSEIKQNNLKSSFCFPLQRPTLALPALQHPKPNPQPRVHRPRRRKEPGFWVNPKTNTGHAGIDPWPFSPPPPPHTWGSLGKS